MPASDLVPIRYEIPSQVAAESVKKEIKPSIELSGAVIGVTVRHKTFGSGKVIELARGFITVAFTDGEKRFEFPAAFNNGFLTF